MALFICYKLSVESEDGGQQTTALLEMSSRVKLYPEACRHPSSIFPMDFAVCFFLIFFKDSDMSK